MVIGAGYSGLIAAKRTAKLTNAHVTLINARDAFVERVRMHQLSAGESLNPLPLSDLLRGTGVSLVVDTVTAIDTEARVVTLAGSPAVPYEILVYALGSRTDPGSTPGAAEHAFTVSTYEDAARLRDRLRDSQSVVVVGAGLTGIEAATELAEARPGLKVRLVTSGALGTALSRRGRRYLWKVVNRLGIEVVDRVKVAKVREDGVVLHDGSHVAADTVVWTTGFSVPALAGDAGIAVDDHGRMIVDETLRSVSHPEIYGVGDAAAVRRPNGQELRMACATGMPSAQHAARVIADRLRGRTPKPVQFRYFNQCVSLGRKDGLIQFVRPDDTPIGAVLTGRAAAAYKEAIVRSTIFVMRHPGARTFI
ncbi:FAD-dependent oxidoreductase [Nonomuraea helvata]